MSEHISVINGPNLRLLGRREIEKYGPHTLDEVNTALEEHARGLGVTIDTFQSDAEAAIVTWISEIVLEGVSTEKVRGCIPLENHKVEDEQARKKVNGIIINAAAYTHTSHTIPDALRIAAERKIPIVEVHLTNTFQREEFRHTSLIAPLAKAVVAGFKIYSYTLALDGIVCFLRNKDELGSVDI